MNKHFLIATVIIVALFATVAVVVRIFFNAPQVPVTCTPALQLELVERFKINIFVLGLISAVFAAALYYSMLRYQVFFPGLDVKRFVAATVVGVVFALALIMIDFRSGSQCLRKALSPGSPIEAELSSIGPTLFGPIVANVWLAVFLDQLILTLAVLTAVKLGRKVWLGWQI